MSAKKCQINQFGDPPLPSKVKNNKVFIATKLAKIDKNSSKNYEKCEQHLQTKCSKLKSLITRRRQKMLINHATLQ